MCVYRGNYERYPPGGGGVAGRDPILPAVLEFREESEDAFLHAITTDLDPTDIQFKLAPTYTLYMAARFRWVVTLLIDACLSDCLHHL